MRDTHARDPFAPPGSAAALTAGRRHRTCPAFAHEPGTGKVLLGPGAHGGQHDVQPRARRGEWMHHPGWDLRVGTHRIGELANRAATGTAVLMASHDRVLLKVIGAGIHELAPHAGVDG